MLSKHCKVFRVIVTGLSYLHYHSVCFSSNSLGFSVLKHHKVFRVIVTGLSYSHYHSSFLNSHFNQQSSQFVHDLTTDGDIESNPGPSLTDDLRDEQLRPVPAPAWDNIDTLKPKVWINDDVIGLYGDFLTQSSHCCQYFPINDMLGAIAVFHYQLLLRKFNYLITTMKEGVPAKRFIFMPVNDGLFGGIPTHWTILVCDIKDRLIYSIDSLFTEQQHLEDLEQFRAQKRLTRS
ncbi:hypothetical protein GEMRC1_004025 [Eukaryota sp. GEM-RC1]